MTRQRSSRTTAGAVYLEFLLAFPPLWVFCLCILQLVLVARADLMVRHAADSAARSAAVVLPDDPARYGGEPKMSVSRERSSRAIPATTAPSMKQESVRHTPFSRVLDALSPGTPSRRETIATAARVPLIPLASARAELDGASTVASALGPKSISGALTRAFPDFLVEFPSSTDGRIQGPEVTVRVTFRYRCTVPVARHLVCDANLRSRVSNETVWRFEHSSTLLVHEAPYQYRSALES